MTIATRHAPLVDTAPTHARQRPVEEFSSTIRAICGNFGIEPSLRGQGLVAGTASRLHLSRFETAVVSCDAERVMRDARMIRDDPGGHLFLIVQDKGTCRIHQSGKSHLLEPGDMFLVDSAQPSDFVYAGQHARQVSLHLPREEMLHRFGPACTGGLGIDRDDPLFLAMRAVLAKLFIEDAVAAPHLGEALLSLLGAYLRCIETQTGMAEKREEAVLSRALAIMERRCHDAGFGPAELADDLAVSPRTLQRHFSALGETASERLMAIRLDMARARLEAPASRADSVSTIAFESGFNDLSYFYRTFRKRFGVSPGAARPPLSP
ncbi:helix-turn-helix domain-containing protein [Roseicyclus sp. F158]|uniref:Helix-turn-helix domain-containing protein n=1 Tax=Tropicimonas omnivorans TaxID=3075590 RepID=A0ABU3DKJ8_9RHOB|nr:helix-turn-helix domain-containing protein [Roseicyclus sp. F158]MDT0684244.1 helix-turn-helix domain-containing protein [Roseicyclus sp. F158]